MRADRSIASTGNASRLSSTAHRVQSAAHPIDDRCWMPLFDTTVGHPIPTASARSPLRCGANCDLHNRPRFGCAIERMSNATTNSMATNRPNNPSSKSIHARLSCPQSRLRKPSRRALPGPPERRNSCTNPTPCMRSARFIAKLPSRAGDGQAYPAYFL